MTGDVTDAELNAALASLGPMFQVSPSQLRLERVKEDEFGNRHFRFAQIQGDQDVIGGDLMVHVDTKGTIYSVTGTTRNVVAKNASKAQANLDEGVRQAKALPAYQGASVRVNRTAYVIGNDGIAHLSYESVAEGFRGQDPFVDYVYTDVDSGAQIAVHPRIHFAENRRIHNAKNGTSLPGTLIKVNGVLQSGQTTDAVIDLADNNHHRVYDVYATSFNRDSYNGSGATITGTVHYSSNYVNAFWNGTQMVYGDGNGSDASALVVLDVVGHELTHAVTENESNLTYSGESGGINESMSDIFGGFVEYKRDGAVSANTWLVGEECWTPGTPGDALRYMADPAKDGGSHDFWTTSTKNVDVHYSSGVGNLAFYLLAQGGQHPRGKSTNVVTGIGIEKAAQIFYYANANLLGPSSDYAALRTACVNAATTLYGAASQEKTSCEQTFTAVGVGGTTPPNPGGTLQNGVPVTGVAGASGSETRWTFAVPAGATAVTIKIAGGSGDADLYTKYGTAPTTSVYDCRPYANGNTETCNATPGASGGTYHVMLRGYSAYSGVTLTATYTTTTPPPPSSDLQDGQTVSSISGAKGSNKFWKTVSVPAGRSITVTLAGGTGDADLYVRKNSAPTTSTYDCRPYKTGNSEVCTLSATTATVYHIMLRGYSAYSGTSINVNW